MLDFTNGAHNFTPIMELAKELGMYMIIRPGPYINAEANGGGFPLWVTTGEYGTLRNSDPRYTKAWEPYMTEIAKVIKPHLITNGGNVILYQIENELNGQWKNIENRVGDPDVQEYMHLMEENARENGIDVPLTHNAPNMVSRGGPGLFCCSLLLTYEHRMDTPGPKTSRVRRVMSMLLDWTATRLVGPVIFRSARGRTALMSLIKWQTTTSGLLVLGGVS